MNIPGQQGQGPSPYLIPLIGRYDKDAGPLRPQWYHCDVAVPVAANGSGIGSIKINAQPFTMTAIAHGIIGPTSDSQSGLVQDGQYSVEWRDEQSSYVDGPIKADLMWGAWCSDSLTSAPKPFSFPLAFPGNKTLTFRVTNLVLRTYAADYFTVQIVLHGVGWWGQPEVR